MGDNILHWDILMPVRLRTLLLYFFIGKPVCFIPGNIIHCWFTFLHKIQGPKGSAYEGHVVEFTIENPSTYPFKPPKLKFKTKVFHPNVNTK